MKVHISLPVKNLNDTKEFYSKLLNSQAVKKKSDYLKFEPSHIPLNLTFNESASKVEGTHFGIQVEDMETLDSERERLASLNLITSEENSSVCCYALQNKIWLRDPDGHMWEIFYVIEDSENKIDDNSQCCGKG